MALPTQEIERLTRATSAEQGPYKQLLLLAGSLFSISLILYLGLSYGYEPYLNKQKDDLDAQIQAFSQKISQDDQAKLVGFYSQLANIKTLLGKHPLTSKAFDWLERNTQSNTYFTKFAFNVPTSQLTLLGNSKSPDDVAEQAAIFEDQPEVLRLNLNNLAAAPGGGWQFNMTIAMDPKSLLSTNLAASGATPPAPATASAPPAGNSSAATVKDCGSISDASAGVLVGLASNPAPNAQEKDSANCMDLAIKNCSPAKIALTKGGNIVVGQILGGGGNNCSVSTNLSYADSRIATCNVPTSFISSASQNPAASNLSIYLAINNAITMNQAGFKPKTPNPQTAWLDGCTVSGNATTTP